MPKKQYGWAAGEIPEIAPHSLAKHRILREYIQRYIHVLTATPGQQALRLTLVDGFAGGGEYREKGKSIIVPGSPQILIDAVRAAEVSVNSSRSKPVKIDARYFFVDSDPAAIAHLHEVLRKRGDQPKGDGVVNVLPGNFEAHLESIISNIQARGRARRTIIVLDQYGYTDVPVSMLERIFEQLPNAEVFLTLAVGWITAYLPNARAAAKKLGIADEVITRLAAIQEDDVDIGDPKRRPDLLAIQRILHHSFTSDIKSRFYTPFFIVSRESNRPYWFLHMANSARANDVVKTLHWEIENHFEHYGTAGLTMLGYDPSADSEITGQTAFQFDNAARLRTLDTLLTELPKRIFSRHQAGVSFEKLHEDLCNETPATRALLAESIKDLCVGENYKSEVELESGGPPRRCLTVTM